MYYKIILDVLFSAPSNNARLNLQFITDEAYYSCKLHKLEAAEVMNCLLSAIDMQH